MNPKLQDFLNYCDNKDSIVLFFKLAGELLEHLQLPYENEKVVLNVTKGTEGRRISLDLNSRLAMALFQNGSMGFMLGRDFINLHRAELEFVNEAKFTDREPIASFLSFPFDFVKDHLELFKSEWLKCCKEYAPRNERSPYLNKNIPELLKYVHEPELILSEESVGNKVRKVVKTLKQSQNITTNMESPPLNLILYGPPGTGKTYNSINRALSIIDPGFDLTQDRNLVKAEFDKYVAEGRIAFTTFHQSMSYEDFIEGIKPQPPGSETGNAVTYDIDAGIFKTISKRAGPTNNLTVTIDEEVLPLTKELFTDFYKQFATGLPDIRIKSSEVILKTSKGKNFELFRNKAGSIAIKAGAKRTDMSVPVTELIKVLFENKVPWYPSYEQIIIEAILKDKSFKSDGVDHSKLNFVLIIDEINRGNIAQIFGELITLIEEDKRLGNEESLEALLPYSKQKFGVPRNLYIIGTMNTADRSVEALDTALRRRFSFEEISPDATLIAKEIPDVDVKRIMITINKRLEKLLDKDHLIGHSYFMKVENLTDLKEVFQRNIIPLLQEYFFGDFGKIGLVLGTGFVEKIENDSSRIFAKFYDYESSDLEDRPVYRIQKVSEMDDEHFIDALKTLLRNDQE